MNSKLSNLSKNKVIEAFNKMDYGEVKQSTQLSDKWLSDNFVKTEGTCEAIINILTQQVVFMVEINANKAVHITKDKKGSHFKDSIEKYCFFNVIINALKKNADLLSQLEMCIRGLSHKDTMKSLGMFFDYFTVYSSMVVDTFETVYPHTLPTNISLSYLGYAIAQSLCFYEEVIITADPKLFVILSAIKKILTPECDKYGIKIHIYAYINGPSISSKTPVVIFNDADLHSACDSVINAAFSEQGQMPWSVNTVFVQDDILEKVVTKLKHQLNNLTFGESNNKQVDFSFPYLIDKFESNYDAVIADAKSKGIEVYQSENSKQKIPAILLTGGKLYSNSILTPSVSCVPYLNVLGFRSIKEAITLCNNQQQSFAATIWSDNVALTNEIVHSLNVGTIWVNTHGVFNACVPFTLYKNGPVIGGYDGYDQGSEDQTINEPVSQFISNIRSVQLSWSKQTSDQRIQILQSVALKLNDIDKSTNPLVNKWQNALIGGHINELSTLKVQIFGSIELKQFKEPKGLIYYQDNIENHEDKIVSAMRNGNSVLVPLQSANKCKALLKILLEITTQLPGVLSLFDFEYNNYYFREKGVFLCTSKLYPQFDIFCNYKNVWTSVGENYV